MMMRVFLPVLIFSIVFSSCSAPTATKVQSGSMDSLLAHAFPDSIPDTFYNGDWLMVYTEESGNYEMDEYRDEPIDTVFNDGYLFIRKKQIMYQHGHTIFWMQFFLVDTAGKILFSDTLDFIADASEYEITELEDGSKILSIRGEWANMGAMSSMCEYYLIEGDSLHYLGEISGYCGGNHWNFDADSTCPYERAYSDQYGIEYNLSRKPGEQFFTVHQVGYELDGEDPCRFGYDSTGYTKKFILGYFDKEFYYESAYSEGKTDISLNISKESALKKLKEKEIKFKKMKVK